MVFKNQSKIIDVTEIRWPSIHMKNGAIGMTGEMCGAEHKKHHTRNFVSGAMHHTNANSKFSNTMIRSQDFF